MLEITVNKQAVKIKVAGTVEDVGAEFLMAANAFYEEVISKYASIEKFAQTTSVSLITMQKIKQEGMKKHEIN